MAKYRRKTGHGLGIGDGAELLSFSEANNVYEHRTFGRVTGMFQGAVWIKNPDGVVPGSPAAAYWTQLEQENSEAIAGKLWAITARGGIQAIGGPSPSPGQVKSKKLITLQSTTIVASMSFNYFTGIWTPLPMIPPGSGGINWPFGLDRSQEWVYPPFSDGIVIFSGFNAGTNGDVLRIALVGTNSSGIRYGMPEGAFNAIMPMDNSDMANINSNFYSQAGATGAIPNLPGNKIYSVEWRLFR